MITELVEGDVLYAKKYDFYRWSDIFNVHTLDGHTMVCIGEEKETANVCLSWEISPSLIQEHFTKDIKESYNATETQEKYVQTYYRD